MNNLRTLWGYTKVQRSGVLFLLSLIIVMQLLYWFVDFSPQNTVSLNTDAVVALQRQVDSLKAVKLNQKHTVYPFNPNYISDFKGYQLGMSVEEIDRLHRFRKQNQWINSATEFQKVTQVSDSLLQKISPYFKFPDWVTRNNQHKNNKSQRIAPVSFIASSGEASHPEKRQSKKALTTTDLNKATSDDFKTISGIGEQLAKRIVKYRKRLQGFSYESQLYEVWGLNQEVASRVLKVFKIVDAPIIQKVNINTATFKDVLKTPYIDYALCKKIFMYRDEVAELQNLSELKQIEGFPIEQYHKIALYLEAK